MYRSSNGSDPLVVELHRVSKVGEVVGDDDMDGAEVLLRGFCAVNTVGAIVPLPSVVSPGVDGGDWIEGVAGCSCGCGVGPTTVGWSGCGVCSGTGFGVCPGGVGVLVVG